MWDEAKFINYYYYYAKISVIIILRREHVKINKQKINIHYHHNYKQTEKKFCHLFHFPCFLTFTRGLSICFCRFLELYSYTDTGKITIAEVLFLSLGVVRNLILLCSVLLKGVFVFSIADTSIYSLAGFLMAPQECYFIYVLNEEERSNWPMATNSLNSFISDWLFAFFGLNWFPNNLHIHKHTYIYIYIIQSCESIQKRLQLPKM